MAFCRAHVARRVALTRPPSQPCGGGVAIIRVGHPHHSTVNTIWRSVAAAHAEKACVHNGRAGWFVAIAFWCGFALLVAAGRDAAVWVRAVVWTGLALLFVATLKWRRPRLTVHLPARIRRWIAGESSEAGPPRRPSPE